jgi:hypothetical protein
MSMANKHDTKPFSTSKRIALYIAIITVLFFPVKYSVFRNNSYLKNDDVYYKNINGVIVEEENLMNENFKKGKEMKFGNDYSNEQNYTEYNIIKKEPLYDKYGIDLNGYIIDGMLNIAINNDTNAKVENLNFYIPPCPNLRPVHYSENILNPVCEDLAFPLENKNNLNDLYVLRLQDITSQMKKWKNWKETNVEIPNYENISLENIVNDDYHPYDYGYDNLEKNEEEDYYNKVVQSPMDEVPDPRRRRLYSMISFDSDFSMLDLYLSEYYEIVDYFIIYESNSTFSGYKKPLYLTRTLLETNRYEKFRNKIIPVTLPILEMKQLKQKKLASPENLLAKKQVIEKGLRAVQARHGDLFFYGDLYEIPKARLLSYLKKCGGWEHLQMPIKSEYDMYGSIAFSSFFYEYSFNMAKSIENAFPGQLKLAIFDARRSLSQNTNSIPTDQKLNLEKRHVIEYNDDNNNISNTDNQKEIIVDIDSDTFIVNDDDNDDKKDDEEIINNSNNKLNDDLINDDEEKEEDEVIIIDLQDNQQYDSYVVKDNNNKDNEVNNIDYAELTKENKNSNAEIIENNKQDHVELIDNEKILLDDDQVFNIVDTEDNNIIEDEVNDINSHKYDHRNYRRNFEENTQADIDMEIYDNNNNNNNNVNNFDYVELSKGNDNYYDELIENNQQDHAELIDSEGIPIYDEVIVKESEEEEDHSKLIDDEGVPIDNDQVFDVMDDEDDNDIEKEINIIIKQKYDHRNYRRSFNNDEKNHEELIDNEGIPIYNGEVIMEREEEDHAKLIDSEGVPIDSVDDLPEKKGENILEKYMKFDIGKDDKSNQIVIYKSGWHMNSFLPNMANFLNKMKNYSKQSSFNNLSDEEKKKIIHDKIYDHRFLLSSNDPLPTIDVKLPKTDEEKYPNLYSYQLWQQINEEIKQNGSSETVNKLNDLLLHELPRQVWENPICYSYMIDREFGFSKKLWWEVIPKQEWATVDFSKLDNKILDEISPLRNTTNIANDDNINNNKRYIKEKY